MSYQFHEPHDIEHHARAGGEGLRRGGFRPRRRPKHAGLLVFLAFVFFVAAFFVLAAVCDPGDEQPPGPAPFAPAAGMAP